MALTILVLMTSVFAIAYARECGKVVELEAKVMRLERALRTDDGIVIDLADYRRL